MKNDQQWINVFTWNSLLSSSVLRLCLKLPEFPKSGDGDKAAAEDILIF